MGNPVYRRGDVHMLANGGVTSRPGSASSNDTLSSVAPPSSGPAPPQVTHLGLGVALNPLNPRSAAAANGGSQRYSSKQGNGGVSSNGVIRFGAKVSPTLGMIPPPPPTPSIHSSGLPEPPMPVSASAAISADPMPNGGGRVANGGGVYAHVSKRNNSSVGAIPKHGGSASSVHAISNGGIASISSSVQNSLARSEASLQQALRENILAASATVAVTSTGGGGKRSQQQQQQQQQHHHQHSLSIQWPRNSIPRRVKKLSWEDEGAATASVASNYGTTTRDRDISTLTDPNVSVTPLHNGGSGGPDSSINSFGGGNNSMEAQQVGRAIYF